MFTNMSEQGSKQILILNKQLESPTTWISSVYGESFSKLQLDLNEKKRSVFDIFWDQINGNTTKVEKSISVTEHTNLNVTSQCTNLNLSSVIHLGAFDVYM